MVEDEPSKMDSIKERLSDIGQKVGDASKKAAKKTSEVSSNIAEDIKVGAKKVSEDVKVGAKKVSETMDKKRDDYREKREETKKAKAEADDAREEELRSVLESTDLIPISIANEDQNKPEEIEQLTVNQLKLRLSDLGLKVSGKKSELVGRLKESLDSTKEKISEMRSSSNEKEEEIVIQEIVAEESPSNTDIMTVPNRKMRYAINWVNRTFFLYYIVLTIAVLGFFTSSGFLEELQFLADRFTQNYGGMDEIWETKLLFETASCLFISSLLYLFGRAKYAAMLSAFLAAYSIIYRLYFAFNA
ncbi:MAG TPA: SAP domain-containing protein, partial [Candidatus Thalassarchaeaceae archaeon]|nr:SAP domain-containing protein [Candidatus Thalassarchaeaceae archaeon]